MSGLLACGVLLPVSALTASAAVAQETASDDGQIARPQTLRPLQPLGPLDTSIAYTDVFLGQNKNGPYELSWQKVLPGAVSVIVDGMPLPAGSFDFNADKGTVAFKNKPGASAVVRVAYRYDAETARRNKNPAGKSLAIPLLSFGSTQLGVTTLADGDAARLVWNLSGKSNLLGGGLTSQILLTPDAKENQASFADRAGLKLDYTARQSGGAVQASFVRSGRAFAPVGGKAFGMKNPEQRWSLGGQRTFAAWLSAEVGFMQQQNLGETGGNRTRNDLTLQLGDKNTPRATLARTAEVIENARGDQTTITTEQANIAAQIGSAASVSAQGRRIVTDAAATDAADKTVTEAQVTIKNADKKPGVLGDATVVLSSKTVAEGGGAQQAQQKVAVRLRPLRPLTVTGEVGAESRTSSGGSGGSGATNAQETTVQAARAEYVASPQATLSGAVQLKSSEAGTDAVREVAATLKPLRSLEIAGSVTDREGVTDLPDSSSAQFTLRPANQWALTGSLQVNPTEKGKLIAATRQEVGVNGQIGSLDLGSRYRLTLWDDDATVSAAGAEQVGELSLTLGLRFSPSTRVTGGYTDALRWGAPTPGGLRTYSLGMSHSAGAFNLSVGGSLQWDKANEEQGPRPAANVKLGLGF